MFFLRLLILFSFSSLALAEHLSQPNKVYNKASQLTVDNLNKTTEMLRDPTKVIGASMGNISITGLKEALPNMPRLSGGKDEQVLHDPTQMSGNFRQALKSYSPQVPVASSGSSSNSVPIINLIGKVYISTERLATEQSKQEKSSVVLDIDEKTIHLREGDKSSVIIKEHIVTVLVEEITKQYVKIRITPSNETLLLH